MSTADPGLDHARHALDAVAADASPVDLAWLGDSTDQAPWALANDALEFLSRLLRQLAPRTVVELGSGISTRILARNAMESEQACSTVSFENDPAYLRSTAQQLEHDGTRGAAELCLAPVVVRRCRGRHLPAYYLRDAPLHSLGADLVLVDGPPEPLGGRAGALLQALRLTRPGGLVVLDDADRPGERNALAFTAEACGRGLDIRILPGFVKGLAAIVVADPPPLPPLPPDLLPMAPDGR